MKALKIPLPLVCRYVWEGGPVSIVEVLELPLGFAIAIRPENEAKFQNLADDLRVWKPGPDVENK